MNHERYMQHALQLAAQADGRTRPNPMVGAVVVCDGEILGEGLHLRTGEAHAEVVALEDAGDHARGADLYVTLEPCCHRGRTAPCTEAIIASGVRQVIYAMRDPNPNVAGQGIAKLQSHDIQCLGPVCEAEARQLNRRYIHFMETGRPYVIAKVGSTLDGKLVDASGASQWITNDATRAYTHAWRARVDAILIGHATVRADDPQLNVRFPDYDGPQPQPILWVGSSEIPWDARIMADAERPVWCVVNEVIPEHVERLRGTGHELLAANSVPQLLTLLGERGVSSIFIEGGPITLSHFMKCGCVDYCIVSLAPKLLGGNARGWTDGATWSLTNAPSIQVEKQESFGDNVIMEGPVTFHV